MSRALLIVLDSVGVGGAPDAAAFGDEGADTLGHVLGSRSFLQLPNLDRLGLGHVARLASGQRPRSLDRAPAPIAAWGVAREVSHGKDTPSGHWEIAGAPVLFDWGYFPKTIPCFPESLTSALVAEAGLPGILGNKHASGTEIIRELGEEHIRSGKPICYTSTDSVFQIAAHETHFGLERLYETCRVARKLTEPLNIGRVIARPFVGDTPETFSRTGNRRDYAVPPPGPTLLDRAAEAGRRVFAIGKIADIFAHRGPTDIRKAEGNMALLNAALKAFDEAGDGDLVFVNLIDFDQLYGHRRDPTGYAAALEAFDDRIPDIESRLRPGDLCVITADHGNDPTRPGTDHTREQVPILAFGPGIPPRFLGRRKSFADIGQTLAKHLGLAALPSGTSFL